jgi:hypothetical protein
LLHERLSSCRAGCPALEEAIVKIAAVALLLSSLTFQSAPHRPLPFTDQDWQLRGDRTAIVKDNGRDILQVETGFGHRRDIKLEDGTIDFEVQLTRRRSFVYVYFRAESDHEREEFYLRPHKSGLPDAAQYAPVWQGRSAWQLHHGPGGTAAIDFEPGAWTPVRVVVEGRHAALFVNDMTKPALLVPHLSREPRAGFIALGGFLPSGTPGQGPVARFANVIVRPGVVSFDFAAALAAVARAEPAAAPIPGELVVRSWAVSQSFVHKDTLPPAIPAASVLGRFQKLAVDAGGLIELHKHVRVPEGNVAAAVARIHVRAARAGTYAFDIGFSDIATVFLNGRPVFRCDASYAFDRPRREGLIGFDQARLYLPLVAGDNDLSVVVSDSFGGWGIMGRFAGAEGLAVEAR